MGGLRGKGEKDDKMAAFAHGALHLNPSPVGLDNGSSDGQAQSHPAFSLGPRLCSPVEAPENPFLVFLGDTHPRVRDLEEGPFSICTERDFYASPGLRVFDPIIHKV